MERVMLSNGSNWFDIDEAILIIRDDTKESISEELYLTRFKNFILHRFSNFNESFNTFDKIDDNKAVEWLIKNNFEELKKFLTLQEIRILENIIYNYEI